MMNRRPSLIVLLALQVVALIVYPPSFFDTAAQAAVLPPIFLLLMLLALIGMNTGTLTPILGRVSLVFIQGINLVIRLMMLFPNLLNPDGSWDIAFLIAEFVGLGLSWYVINQMETRPVNTLLLRQQGA
ncbi:MAG: hypothetical protein RBT47_00770 [Anaerolineae bacterium]|jgi:hypothetical protein|nr:hypothetical protein [Anaerolineae bacterium]